MNKKKKTHKKKARGVFICGMILTVLLAATVFLYGGPVMETARAYIASGAEAVWEYWEANDRTGLVNRRRLYLKEEEKSRSIIKKHLGKDVIPPPDDTQK